ncbi:MAG: tetratricopeptide repeat protein [Pseudomonadota bacterium]
MRARAFLPLLLAACTPLPPPLPPAPAAAPQVVSGPPAAALEHYALAILAWDDGDLDAAATEIGQALLFDPKAAALHATRGRIALDRGDPAEAARALTVAWTLDPDDLSIQVDRARAYAEAGEREKARVAYRLCLGQGRSDAAFGGLIRLLQQDGESWEAHRLMTRWREAALDDPLWLRARAELCLELGLDEEAWEDFAALVERWPPQPPALQGLFAANDRTGHHRRTLELLERVAHATPGDEHVLELLASLAARVGDFERAVPAWEQVDRLEGGQNPFTRLFLAKARLSMGAPGEALTLLDTPDAAAASPTQVAEIRARALLALGQEAEALAALDEQYPAGTGRLQARARLFEEADRLAEARDALRAASLDETGWYQRWDLATLEARTGALDRALALIADNADQDDQGQALAAARLHALAGDLAGAVRLAGEAEAQHRDDPAIAAARARWLNDAGDTAGALAALRAAAARDLVSPDLARQHAALAWEAGAADEARQVLEDALTVFSDDASLQNDLAWLRVEHGEHGPEVLALAWRAVDQEPANAAFLDTLGWVLLQRGQVAEALPELEHAARLDPDNDVIAAHLRAARQAASAGETR